MKCIKEIAVSALISASIVASLFCVSQAVAYADPCGGYYVGQWGGGQSCPSQSRPGFPVWRDIQAPFFNYHGWACGTVLYVDPNVPC